MFQVHSSVVCASSDVIDFEEQLEGSDILRRQTAQRLRDGSMVVALRVIRNEADSALKSKRDLKEVVDKIDSILAGLKKKLVSKGEY